MPVDKSRSEAGTSLTDVVDVLCIQCKRSTEHLIAAFVNNEGESVDREQGWSIDWTERFQVIKCRGCKNVTFRHTTWHSEQNHDDPVDERLYPKRDLDTISAKPFLNLSNTLRRIYAEVVDCFNIECMTLCAAGVRSIVEGVCADQNIADGPVVIPAKGGGTLIVRKNNLEGKIFGLNEKGILTAQGAATLHDLRFLGNDAVHELVRPSREGLTLAIDIVEHILEQLYEIPAKASQLKQKAAARKK